MHEKVESVSTSLEVPDQNLVALHKIDGPWKLDILYATSANITGKPLYPYPGCFLRAGTSKKLFKAASQIATHDLMLVIWDGYRPPAAQQELWNAVPDTSYVAPPGSGSKHTRGAAVDVTLADQAGNLLKMPTGFDDFSAKAAVHYSGLDPETEKRRSLLQNCMLQHGFQLLDSEWWHFEDTEWEKYPLLEVDYHELTSLIKD